MRIIIIGGSGYIGSALVKRLRSEEMRQPVRIIDPAPSFVYTPTFNQFQKNFEDSGVCLADFDVVYHLAALAGIRLCEEQGSKTVTETNVRLTQRIIDSANSGKKKPFIIFASSSAVYGRSNLYSISKLQSEYLLQERYPNSVSVRLGTVFGLSPKMRSGILVNDMVRQAIDGALFLWDAKSWRPYIAIEDCVELLLNLSTTKQRGVIDGYDIRWLHQKGYIASLISNITKCKIIGVKSGNICYQDFRKSPNYIINAQKRINDCLQEVVRYYEK